MQEELKTHPSLLWFDSAVVIHTNATMSQLFEVVKRTNGISLMVPTGHSTYAVTHSQLYQYLRTNISAQMKTMQYGGGLLLIYRTEQIYTNFISWWVLCALQIKCSQPIMKRNCHFKASKLTEFANCHRYDQSSLNILLSNYFKFDDRIYYSN